MILVFFGIAVLLFVAGVVAFECDDDLGGALLTLAIIVFVVALIATLVLGIQVSKLKVLDEQIDMYQEENERIESQIDAAVKQYQEYESGVFADTTVDSSITLVSLYPELKADTLVQEQIKVYMENNATVKRLKSKQINGTVLRWWLYFGK